MFLSAATPSPVPLFTPSAALTTLLTVESLLFAGVAGAVAVSSTPGLAVSPRAAGQRLALGAAAVLTAVAVGASFAWARIFVVDWPSRLDEQIPAACLAVGVAAQPVVAWIMVRLLHRGAG